MRSPSNRKASQTRRRSVREFLQSLILGGNQPAEPRRGRLLLESLEQRQLLAGDMDLLFTDGVSDSTTQQAETGGLQVAGQAEGELAPDLVQFAKDLADAGVIFFGAGWCPHCTDQKELFEDGEVYLPFVEVTNPDRTLNQIGIDEGISTYPTWEFPDGTRLEGTQSLQTLSDRSGVSIPQGDQPTFVPVGNLTVQIGSPLHVPIDAYDPDGGPLTVTVSVQNPALLNATVLTGNRSIRIDMATYGDMVFELFEQRAPVASGRVIDLAEADFYDGIIFHRVANNFVIQGGDPTGTGTSGSTLGNFDDDFNADLQHNREGVLSFAKSSDDTNNSQFFVTEVPTRFLDFNHSIFGQLVEGFDVRESISNTSTPESRGVGSSQRPDRDVTIESIDVFTDTENSVVMLKPTGTSTGTTNVTFTVTDQDGNTHSETIQVAVVNDTANSQPFLNDISTPDPTPNNTAAQLQLSSVDVEGDAVTYFAQSLSSASNGTVSVNAATGLVTVTPASGFTGTIDVRVGVRPGPGVTGNAASDMDTQTVSFEFEGEGVLAPTSVDLQTGSDSGSSNIDNITNAGSLTFLVNGVTSGSTVELVNVGTGSMVGTGVATGSSITITTNNIAALGDGSYQIAARQVSGGDTSTLSPSLTVVYDTTPPASVVGSASTQANIGRAYETDLINSEEGSGLVYALTSAPTGATINASTGVINWTPAAGQEGPNTFTLALTDAAGNQRAESFSVNVADAPLAEVRLEITDLQGNPITSVAVGEKFLLNMIAVDARLFNKPGVFAAYADILFDNLLVRPEPGSTIQFSDQFTLIRKGTFANGLIDELGAVSSSLAATQLGETLIATVRMEALASGTVNIRSEPADESDSEFLLFGNDDQIPAESVAYGSVSLAIGQSFTVANDTAMVAEDSAATTINVLANDMVLSGTGSLSVVSVTQPASGGTVSLVSGIVSFTPAANFNGNSIFTYRVSDTNGVQQDASVTVTVTAVNDPPDAVNDTIDIPQNSSDNLLDVLSNDRIAPDSGETLTITGVGATSGQGSVSIAQDGRSLVYTPVAGFTGTETFTYTISDGTLTDQAQVTVVVAPVDDPPTAVDNSFTVVEDAAEAAFDVLGNDTRDADDQPFVISAVGTPNQGGSARFSSDGTQFFYTPAANFAGTETVTYTIRDTGGGLSIATVTFTVTPVNDAPPIIDLEFPVNRAAGESTVFELEDLPDNVDSGETLTISDVSANTTAGGTARIDATNQSILYTPPSSDFVGLDTITYTIADGSDLTSTGTITINVLDYTERNVFLSLPNSALNSRVAGVMLTGTNLLGQSVALPLAYTDDSAGWMNILPGDYMIEIPAIPFLQHASQPRQIPVTSAADASDAVIESGLGRLRPEFLSIRDWLGSASRNSILVVVAPGESSRLAMPTSAVTTITDPVATLDAAGENVTIEGSDPSSNPSAPVTPVTLPTRNDPRVQVRGEIDGIRLLKISDLTFAPSTTASTTAGAEGEAIVPASASLVSEPLGLLVPDAAPSTLSLGDVQAEGESIAALATTQSDLFVPVASNISTRTDATVLALEEGDLWLGESLRNDADSQGISETQSIDAAMQNVASNLTILSSAADSIAEQATSDGGLDENAIDAVLSADL